MEKRYILMAESGEMCLLETIFGAHASTHDSSFIFPDGTSWQVVFTGVGGVNVIQALQNMPRDAQYLNVGYAGSANFEKGTIVTVNEARVNHPNAKYDEPIFTLSTNVPCFKAKIVTPCYSNTDFVLQSNYRDCVFDMELAFIMALGFKNVFSIKYVSDNLSKHEYNSLTQGIQ